MYKIGIISDTHDLLREEVRSYLQLCQVIVHAGDLSNVEMVTQLEAIAPLYVVRGNNDKGEWAEAIPIVLEVEIQGYRFMITHQKRDIPKDLAAIDYVIYGHSHKYHEEQIVGVYYLNPGSCGKRRFGQPITMATITIDQGNVKIDRIDLEG